MGRIEKDKNLVKFWVDGKAKPYILDINKGELIGLRGAALVTIPPMLASLVYQTPNKTSVLQLLNNGYMPSRNADLYILADKLDAIGITADYYSLRRLKPYAGSVDFKHMAKYLSEGNGNTIDEYITTFLEEQWITKNNLQLDDHFTEPMRDWLYSEHRNQSKEVLHRLAYYLSRGLWEFFEGDCYCLRLCISNFIKYTTALEIPMEKGDFFRQYINAKRAYRINEDALINKSIAINQQKRLEALSFENETFMVVVPMTKEELRTEGELQHNCVGDYGRRIAEGTGYVVFIRRKSDPTKAYITCDIYTDGTINQYLTKYNQDVSADDAKEFYRAYQEHLSTHWGE